MEAWWVISIALMRGYEMAHRTFIELFLNVFQGPLMSFKGALVLEYQAKLQSDIALRVIEGPSRSEQLLRPVTSNSYTVQPPTALEVARFASA